MILKTLLLNPPSFEKVDGGASSRWPATREIESYWYPVWLAYPAAMIPDSCLLDAPPPGISAEATVRIAKEYDFVVLFTSTPGFSSDIRLIERMQAVKPSLKIAFVGPHVTVLPEQSLMASEAIDFVVRGEFDYAVTEFAAGAPLEAIKGVSFRQDGRIEQAREFMKHCKRVGIAVHGDFIIGLPGETPETIERTVKFAQELDCETIQVSIVHAYPGTALHDFAQANGYLRANVGMTDEQGHQLPHLEYPRLSPAEMLQAVEYFYDKYYFRPRIIARIVRKAIFNAEERRRLARAAREFLRLRARRRQFVANQGVWSVGGPR